MRKSIVLASMTLLAIGGLTLLTGCDNKGGKDAGIPVGPKWKGAPYRLAIDAKAPRPNPANIPAITYTANPQALENRAVFVVRFDVPNSPTKGQLANRMIGAPFDIQGETGALPAEIVERASKGLTDFLGAYCADGKTDISVALARSSINPQAGDAELDSKRLSDWLPTVVTLKKSHAKCK
ncbi:MAG: hypothetical protein WCE75_09305 [Terracidiphilus sp.]